MSDIQEKVTAGFMENFGATPDLIVRAPGRVNLIGEHTDYNDGFVLPMAVNRAVFIAARARQDRQVSLCALDMAETINFDLDQITHTDAGWAEYIKGMASVLQQDGFGLRGWEGVMAGDIPIGAGLSSSAALELATARTFAAVSGLPWNGVEMAKLAQRAENQWVGVNCGIMDQMISATGEAGHALLIDCRSLDTDSVPLPPATSVVILDTATRRGLVDSAYNERRQQCETAAAFFGVPALRDVTFQEFESRSSGLDPLTMRRARHIISENERTLEAAKVMQQGDAVKLGRLMVNSHHSMRDDFEISNKELNLMVEIALLQPGCYGARLTGAGFGGCAVALVQAGDAQNFAETVARQYEHEAGLTPQIYICEATDGAALLFDQ
jgi:galactokinase